MNEFVITEAKTETAILVGLITQEQDEAKTKEYLDELEFLADTAGAVTVKRFTQKVGGPNTTSYVGKGKLEEIRDYIKEEAENDRPVGMVIFDDELSAELVTRLSGYPFGDGDREKLAETKKLISDFMYDEAADLIRELKGRLQ